MTGICSAHRGHEPTCKQCNALSMCERCGRPVGMRGCLTQASDSCREITIARLTADRDKWRAAWQSELAANDRLSAEIVARGERIGRLRASIAFAIQDEGFKPSSRLRLNEALGDDDAAAGGKEPKL